MASIKISDLRPSGFNLFVDSESFLDELSESDLATINGGATPYITRAVPTLTSWVARANWATVQSDTALPR